MKKSILVLACVFMFTAFFTSCREEKKEKHEMEMSDDMDHMDNDLEDAADDTGDAIKKAADKTGKAIEKTAKKVEDKLEGDDS
ncbi:MAG TPA: hypothetical protein VFD29_03165 [Gillisia sp.]|nr:hypothetical protein [Gillisia sp.]